MDLEVVARHALLFDDDPTAAFVNSREALVPWNDDATLLIDRYDVRHLLEQIPARPPRGARKQHSRLQEPGGISQSDLDLERYLDLPDDQDDGGEDAISEKKQAAEEAGSGGYQAVPFSYGNSDISVDPENPDSGLNYTGFHPPFPVPKSILSNLPPTEKLHQIIARTAIFVSEHGGQSEIVLRVKQGDNPTFGFLMPDHHLHAYFRFLVDHPQLLKSDIDSIKTKDEKESAGLENEACAAAGGALSLLGSVYGTGEDDDGALEGESEEMESGNLNVSVKADRAEHEESSTPMDLEDKALIRHPVVATTKEKTLPSRRNHSVNAFSASAAFSKKTGELSSLNGAMGSLQSSRPSVSDVKPLVLEPPSFLKRTVDKIVEFILRNGKEFEAVLIEQDSTNGRFPFLLPSNQYHPYYLKSLQEARESKLLGNTLADQKHDAQVHVGSKKKVQEALTKGSAAYDQNSAEQLEGWSFDPQRKEKFKMTIGGPKKDAHDQHSKPARQSGMSADEAAAIVLSATRGLSPANPLPNKPLGKPCSGMSADEAAAIVLAATRSLSPPKALPNKLLDLPSTGVTPRESGRTSSIGSFSSLHGQTSILKSVSNGEAGISLHVDLSGSTEQLDRKGCSTTGDLSVAKVIAKTAALAAASEADSSEACLTSEQKQKAERLKRAKMFAAMIKSGGPHINEILHTAHARSGSLDTTTVGSTLSGAESNLASKEREGSTVPIDAEISDVGVSQEKDQNREHKSRKKHHSRSRDHEEDSEEDHKHSRKKHRSEHSSRHSRDGHKRRSSSSKDKKSRHHHKNYSSSEDEHGHRKSSRSHHRHQNHSFSEDEDRRRERSYRHRRKSYSERKREIEDEDDAKLSDHSKEVSLNLSNDPQEVATPAVPDAQPSNAMEVPDELRAKVRAMLLATL